MNNEQEDVIWMRLSSALFGRRKTTDEGLFTYQVMERIRTLHQDVAWPQFLRWSVPALGFGLASLLLAVRAPAPPVSQLMDSALFHQQTPNEDGLFDLEEEELR